MDEKLIILSIDGIGAFDHVSRNSMLRGLMETDVANGALPFVRQFYGQPSAYFWDDEMGDTQVIPQGEGGEQGDPLMPLLFCLSLHRALVAANARLQEGESLFAFLDDVYATCAPDRVLAVHRILQQEIQTHCCISVHHGKTQIWNRGGQHPVGCESLTTAAQTIDPNAVVWRGDTQLPPHEQGIIVLGSPVGQEAFIMAQLVRQTRRAPSLAGQDPVCVRCTDCMVVATVLWCHTGQLLDSDSEPPILWRFCARA